MGSFKEFDQEDCPECGVRKYYDKTCGNCGYTPSNSEVAIGTVLRLIVAVATLCLVVYIFFPVGDFVRSLFSGGNVQVIGSIEIYQGSSVSVPEKDRLLRIEDKMVFKKPFRWDESKLQKSYDAAMYECVEKMAPLLMSIGESQGIFARGLNYAQWKGTRFDRPVFDINLNSYIAPPYPDKSVMLYCRRESHIPDFLKKLL